MFPRQIVRAAHPPNRIMDVRFAIFLTLLTAFCGCSARTGPRGLASDDSAEKIPALKAAGEQRDAALVPRIIPELANDDPAVRFYAIEALRRITGETFGYRFYDSPDQQKEAIARWQDWARQHPMQRK
jgi:hypothetical protein